MASYKIREFNEASGQLIVEYSENMAPFAVDIPLVNGVFITGAELDTYIKGFIPHEFIERQAQLAGGVANAEQIRALVEAWPEKEEVNASPLELQQQELENNQMWVNIEFEKRIAAALVKFNVLQTNPTEIPVEVQ